MLRDYSYVALGNILCFPYFVTKIRQIRKIHFKKDEQLSLDIRSHTMAFCFSGSGTGHFVNNRKKIDQNFNIKKNQLFYWEPQARIDLKSKTNNLFILLLDFSLFAKTINRTTPPESLPMDFFTSPQSDPCRSISMNLPFSTEINQSNLIAHYIFKILNAIETPSDRQCSLAEALLPAVLVHWLRISQKEIHSMLNHVTCIKISDDMANYEPIKENQEIYISNVEIWNADPKQKHSEHLFSFSVQHVRQGYPQWPGSRLDTQIDTSYLRIFTPVESAYSFYLQPIGNVASINLRPFQDTCYIRFRIYSNKPINLGLSLYNDKVYLGLGHICYYTTPGVWQEEQFPLLTDYQRLNNRIYVEQATSYIETNYARTLTRKEIAQHLHISEGYLSNLFYQTLGISLPKYIRQIRLAKAVALLSNTTLSIEEIAFQTGFCDMSQFSKCFLNEYGIRPNTYSKNLLATTASEE